MKKNKMSDDTPEQENPMLKQVGGSHYMYMKPYNLLNLLTKISCFLQRATL